MRGRLGKLPDGALVAAAALSLFAAAAARAEPMREQCARRAPAGGHEACAEAVRRHPGDPGLRRLYAIGLYKSGRYDAALTQYAMTARLEPRRFRAAWELGWMLAFVGRYGEAIAPLERARALRPDDVRTLRTLAIVYAAAGRPRDAFRAIRAGARLGDRIAMFDMADHYRNGRGVTVDRRRALAWLRRAARAGHVLAMDHLVRVYMHGEMGQPRDAREAERWAERAYKARDG